MRGSLGMICAAAVAVTFVACQPGQPEQIGKLLAAATAPAEPPRLMTVSNDAGAASVNPNTGLFLALPTNTVKVRVRVPATTLPKVVLQGNFPLDRVTDAAEQDRRAKAGEGFFDYDEGPTSDDDVSAWLIRIQLPAKVSTNCFLGISLFDQSQNPRYVQDSKESLRTIVALEDKLKAVPVVGGTASSCVDRFMVSQPAPGMTQPSSASCREPDQPCPPGKFPAGSSQMGSGAGGSSGTPIPTPRYHVGTFSGAMLSVPASGTTIKRGNGDFALSVGQSGVVFFDLSNLLRPIGTVSFEAGTRGIGGADLCPNGDAAVVVSDAAGGTTATFAFLRNSTIGQARAISVSAPLAGPLFSSDCRIGVLVDSDGSGRSRVRFIDLQTDREIASGTTGSAPVKARLARVQDPAGATVDELSVKVGTEWFPFATGAGGSTFTNVYKGP